VDLGAAGTASHRSARSPAATRWRPGRRFAKPSRSRGCDGAWMSGSPGSSPPG